MQRTSFAVSTFLGFFALNHVYVSIHGHFPADVIAKRSLPRNDWESDVCTCVLVLVIVSNDTSSFR